MPEQSIAQLSRRSFLRAVGVTGGAGTMFATMGALGLAPASAAPPPFDPPKASDFHLTGRRPGTVIVLGGGIAGLVSAYELGKAGYRVTVLEPRDRTGGRNFTVRGGDTLTDLHGFAQRARFSKGQYMNAGPARIAQWMVTLDYCRELGVPIEVFTNSNADAYIYHSSMPAGQPMRYRTAKADTFGYVSELLAKATDQGALDAELTAEDRERLMEFLTDFGDLGETLEYTGSSRRGFTAWPGESGAPGEILGDVPSASAVFASGVGRHFSFEFEFDQAMLMFQPVGGMDRLPRALTRAIGPQKIKLGCRATSLTQSASGVSVTYTDAAGCAHLTTADYVIAAMPPHLLTGLTHNLGADVVAALTAIRPSSAGKIGLEYRSRWWETDHRIYGGITETDLDLVHVWHPSYGYHGDRGVMIGYYHYGATADRYSAMSPKDRETTAVALGERIYGAKYRTELDSSFSIAWREVPHLEAAWHSFAGNSPQSPIFKPLVEPAGRVLFAGDWLSNMDAWQHGAILAARKAVTTLHARALAR
ncbi:flavin monoamine oxidase [Actinoplanes ianthinogenes]|uniref:Flavin monoamine oxidase n=1 Tax=Actinoplanes ianthinogenes TaxID=122358 RepID=A0ABM7M5N3_9ACTN|nr:FAD-dependent oxidoreductase [Actinoplanes ianthinogenes]BCJ46964.1 flavin monoamine oxidase [Actinoplanes ianthinogenes]GGR14325.1 flavin monoamine oxidase [Actinoplanes ianthinogenes]